MGGKGDSVGIGSGCAVLSAAVAQLPDWQALAGDLAVKGIHHRGAENAKFGMDLSFAAARRTRRANAVLFAMVSLTLVVQLPFH